MQNFGLPIIYVSTYFHFPFLFKTPSVFLSACPNHPSLASLILMFATTALVLISSVLIISILFIPIFIHLNILICVLSSSTGTYYSAFLINQGLIPYITAITNNDSTISSRGQDACIQPCLPGYHYLRCFKSTHSLHKNGPWRIRNCGDINNRLVSLF